MNNILQRLSPRERGLALAVAVLVSAAVVFTVVQRATNHLRVLDAEIDQLENRLITCAELEARSTSVEQAYAAVAAQHSSAWTETEIHNRLRDEIYRLAQEDPDSSSGASRNLVDIPSLHQGVFRDTGQGYREYQLSISIPMTDMFSVLRFLTRLQNSEQSLRVDEFEFARSPEGPQIAATIVITRTVIDGPTQAEPESPLLDADGSGTDLFTADQAELAIVSDVNGITAEGGSCVKATGTGDEATVSITQQLQAGTLYELTLDLATTAQTSLAIKDADTDTPYESPIEIKSDGSVHRYRVSFKVTGDSGPRRVCVPYIKLLTSGAKLYIDNVRLSEAAL